MDEAWRQKLKDIGLKYYENTIEMKIDWEKVVFPKEQPIKWTKNWQDSMDAINDLWWMKPIEKELFDTTLLLYFSDLDGIFPKYKPLYTVKWVSSKDVNPAFGEVILLNDYS